MKRISIIILLVGLIGVIAVSGCISSGVGSVVDPCERQFNDCNHRCGEGFLNSICKEGCTSQYNQCRQNK